MTKCEMLIKWSPYPFRKVTLGQVEEEAKKHYTNLESMNFLQWNSSHGDLSSDMIRHLHYLIIDGVLVKSRHGW